MDKILFVVFTCNRLHYLKNCVNSILLFNDPSQFDLMVIDNNSIEGGTDDFLNSLPSSVKVHKFKDRCPNELYRAMNYSIKYCFDNKIEIVHFIQDDYQYLYSNPCLMPTICETFSENRKIAQISVNLVWKRKSIGDHSWIKVNNVRFAVLKEKMTCDSGFTRVSVYKKTGFYPVDAISYDQNSRKTFGFGKNRYKNKTNGEIWFGTTCKKNGFQRAICLQPNTAMMFDSAYVRGMQRFGRYFPPPNDFYLQPFDKSKIDYIKSRNDRYKFSFIEDMVTAWGWKPTTMDKHNKEGLVNNIEK